MRYPPPDAGASDVDAKLESLAWVESLEDVLYLRGTERARLLLGELQIQAQRAGVQLPATAQTPYVNTIPVEREPAYPGDREIERRIKSLVRWNALAMVVRANRDHAGIGGHISTFASIATLYEVGLNHFFRGPDHPNGGDLVYFQGHASPGNYARAYLEGRLDESHLRNFRRDLASPAGLSSYPHPWLMPDFWSFPTVSMGLGPIMAIHQARLIRYLEHRGIKEAVTAPHHEQRKVWCFVGDGETDEPESLAAISMGARAQLDNLIFVVNCNLQRLDGPVRGNGKIIQELESVFRGVGWNVIKVIWGSEWDDLLARDDEGRLARRMGDAVDGDYQKYGVEGGAYIREHFYGRDPKLAAMVEHLSDEQLWKMRYGGHDPAKVHAAFHAAVRHKGTPTVILAKTIKGYGLGEAGEGRNVTHQQKKLNEAELRTFRDRFEIPVPDGKLADVPFHRPDDDSPEMTYLREHRRALGGALPARRTIECVCGTPKDESIFDEFLKGTKSPASTTMVLVRLLSKLLKDPEVGRYIVPIVPDEARTFGMEALFRQVGIYSPVGQLYSPVDAESLLYYKEARDGQILEEGITEAGSMASFIAAGTAYANHGVGLMPFFLFYSMFGFQRVGDLVWAAGDSRARGFLIGATSGRTTLNGEGLQHQDGHSHVMALTVPNLVAYDVACAGEVALVVQEGMRRMFVENEDVFYYLTVGNENQPHPPIPAGARDGVLRGLYRHRAADKTTGHRAQLLGSGALLREALKAQEILAERYDVHADVWGATSYQQLHRDALACSRNNLLHPGDDARRSHVATCLGDAPGPIVATSDYLKSLPGLLAGHLGRRIHVLGTDGYGRSDTRENLRDFFEVDHRFVVLATLRELARDGEIDGDIVRKAIGDLDIDPDKTNPMTG